MSGRSVEETASASDQLVDAIADFYDDPLGYVYFAFSWGQEGTVLHDQEGPDDWQIQVLTDLGEAIRAGVAVADAIAGSIRIAVASGHGIGKQLKYNEKVYCPGGWREIGSLKVGDQVLGGDGRPCRVTGIYPQGVQRLYRVRFSDGSSVLAGAEHQWSVTTKADRDRGKAWRTVTTADMDGKLHRRFQIPMCGAAQFTERPVSLDPYVLGYLLANGCLCTASAVRVSSYDEEVFDEIGRRLPDGYGCHGNDDDGRYRHISQPTGNYVGDANPVWLALQGYGLTGVRSPEKFIPDDFLYNTVERRIDLLRGLMDGDGCISPRKGREGGYRCVYSTSSERLRDQMIWLVQSLGGVAGFSADDRRGVERSGFVARHINYQVSINLPNGINPFAVARKRDLYEEWAATTKREPIRAVTSIELEEEAEAYCISVDNEDRLYLTNDFIVTHNSALVAWIVLWFISTRPNCQIVVTANTKAQLTTKTWRELKKWQRLAINGDWFQWTATKFYFKAAPETWFAAAIPWTAENSESFAGTHERHVLIIFDEASKIEDIIWEVTEGAMTTARAIWIAFGNPTRNSGRFRECFFKYRRRWLTYQVDSRTSRIATNKKQIEEWIQDYGEDSDFVRVRVRGIFPRAGTNQLIAQNVVEEAQARVAEGWEVGARVLSVDPARFGDDRSVILVRQGRKILSIREFRELSTTQLAYRVKEDIEHWRPDAVFVDAIGIGVGVVDMLEHLGCEVVEVIGNETANEETRFHNKRAENWWTLREWLTKGWGSLHHTDDEEIELEGNEIVDVVGSDRLFQQLADDLTILEYGYDNRDRVQLERKEDVKSRGYDSPDFGDALSMTFAYPVEPRGLRARGDGVDAKLRALLHGQTGGRSHMSY